MRGSVSGCIPSRAATALFGVVSTISGNWSHPETDRASPVVPLAPYLFFLPALVVRAPSMLGAAILPPL